MSSQSAGSTAMATPALPPKQRVALPLHVQKLQRALNLDNFIDQVERAYNESLAMRMSAGYDCFCFKYLGLIFVRCHRSKSDSLKQVKKPAPRVYNFMHVTEERQWVKASEEQYLCHML